MVKFLFSFFDCKLSLPLIAARVAPGKPGWMGQWYYKKVSKVAIGPLPTKNRFLRVMAEIVCFIPTGVDEGPPVQRVEAANRGPRAERRQTLVQIWV